MADKITTYKRVNNGFTYYVVENSRGECMYNFSSLGNSFQSSLSSVTIIQDFSWSMKTSNSSEKAYNALLSACNKLFKNYHNVIHIILFGGTSCFLEVNKNNYISKIDSVMGNYNEIINHIDCNCKFNITSTRPDIALNLAVQNMSKNKKQHIMFMTDGSFSEHDESYANEWKKLSNEISKCHKDKKITILTIGYENDDLHQMKELHKEITRNNFFIDFRYKTVSKSLDIFDAVMSYVTHIIKLDNSAINLSNGKNILPGTSIYCNKAFTNNSTKTKMFERMSDLYGVSIEWLKNLFLTRIDLGILTNNVRSSIMFNLNLNTIECALKSKDIISKQFYCLKKEIHGEHNKFILPWIEFMEEYNVYLALINYIIETYCNKVTDKKVFEIETNFKDESFKYILPLNGRIIKMNERDTIYVTRWTSHQTINLDIVSCNKIKKIKQKMTISRDKLNEYFECFVSKNRWDDLLDSLIGIPIGYNYNSNDNELPSESNVRVVNTNEFISDNGYFDACDMYNDQIKWGGTLNDEHIPTNIKHMNTYVPLAVDPFFLNKINIVRERLSLILTNSIYNYVPKYINFYVAVIEQVLRQYFNNKGIRCLRILYILIHTFKILYNKEYKTSDRIENIYNISTGNTRCFESVFHVACVIMVSKNSEINITRMGFNKVHGTELDYAEFNNRLWLMLYRAFVISNFKDSIVDDWCNLSVWISEAHDKKSNAIESLLMSDDKLISIPNKLEKNTLDVLKSTFNDVFVLLFTINSELKRMNYFKKAISNPVMESVENINNYVDITCKDKFEITHHTLWECKLYGVDKCYPIRLFDEIRPQIVSKINENNLTKIRERVSKISKFRQLEDRILETKYFPAVFKQPQVDELNALFLKVYSKEISRNTFTKKIKSMFDQFILKGINIATLNGFNVIDNLYNHCMQKVNVLILKKNGLPFSAPAIPTSPKFLQVLSDNEFRKYFEPLGMENGKDETMWINNFHNFMLKYKYLKENDFVKLTIVNSENNVKLLSGSDKQHFQNYIRMYYGFINN